MSLLDDDQIAAALAELEGWRVEGKCLAKTWRVKPYFKAAAFVQQIAWLAEMQNHHPDIALSWGRVEVRTTSHDLGGLTTRDIRLAKAIDEIVKDF